MSTKFGERARGERTGPQELARVLYPFCFFAGSGRVELEHAMTWVRWHEVARGVASEQKRMLGTARLKTAAEGPDDECCYPVVVTMMP